FLRLLASLIACSQASQEAQKRPASPCGDANVLTEKEKAAGWELLFDGKSLSGWHGYNGQSTQSWAVEGCAIKSVGTEGNYGSDLRADLVTGKQYENFELSIDWKASKGGNSGLMYGVVEDPKYKAAWMTGPEYQFIDDVGFPEKLEEWPAGRKSCGHNLKSTINNPQSGGRNHQSRSGCQTTNLHHKDTKIQHVLSLCGSSCLRVFVVRFSGCCAAPCQSAESVSHS